MFEKVLIVEDHDVANLSLRRTLVDLNLPNPDYAYYCDIALSKIRKALQCGQPYDLLITDLYFEADGTAQQLPDGADLIKAAKALQPDVKILVFSAESRLAVIQPLYDELGINGYVRKARGDAQQLRIALDRITQNLLYYPRDLWAQSAQENLYEFTDFDKTIIRLLSQGHAQKDIPDYLIAHNIHPSGLSSIEKRLNLIKTSMGFSKNEQLVAFCKEMRLI